MEVWGRKSASTGDVPGPSLEGGTDGTKQDLGTVILSQTS